MWCKRHVPDPTLKANFIKLECDTIEKKSKLNLCNHIY